MLVYKVDIHYDVKVYVYGFKGHTTEIFDVQSAPLFYILPQFATIILHFHISS